MSKCVEPGCDFFGTEANGGRCSAHAKPKMPPPARAPPPEIDCDAIERSLAALSFDEFAHVVQTIKGNSTLRGAGRPNSAVIAGLGSKAFAAYMRQLMGNTAFDLDCGFDHNSADDVLFGRRFTEVWPAYSQAVGQALCGKFLVMPVETMYLQMTHHAANVAKVIFEIDDSLGPHLICRLKALLPRNDHPENLLDAIRICEGKEELDE